MPEKPQPVPSIRSSRPAPYKIKDVSALTGVSRETIRFYINEGLLPPPEKSARNMAWYTDQHIELLQLIQKLQREQFLPLKAIKSLVNGTSDFEFTAPQAKVLQQIRQRLAVGSRGRLLSEGQVSIARSLGLPRADVKELGSLGVELGDKVTVSDIEVAELWLKLKHNGLSSERGFSPRDLTYLVELVDIAVQRELRYFEQKVKAMSPDEAARMAEIVVPTLSRIFAVLHERRLGMFIQRYLEQRTPATGKAASKADRKRRPGTTKK